MFYGINWQCTLIGSGSYLTGRIQRVVIENAVSGDQELGFGGPTGFCFGSEDILHVHANLLVTSFSGMGLSHHSYADDTQLYMTMDHSNNNWWDGLARISIVCNLKLGSGMNQNMFKAE